MFAHGGYCLSAQNPTRAVPADTGFLTYLILTLTSSAFALLAAPQLLASVGLVSHDSLQGWVTFIGMWLALPLLMLVPAAAILTLVGLVRGPYVIRVRLGVWWAIALGGALSLPTPGFNPYTGPQPTFGLGDAVLALCLGLCISLALTWLLRASRSRPPSG